MKCSRRILRRITFGFLGTFLFSFSMSAQSSLITLDFENFNLSDNLATVNTYSTPLGATFSAVFPATFSVVQDPNNVANKILSSQTLPSDADVLINFTSAVNFVMVEFIDNPQGANLNTALHAFDQNNPSTSLPLLGNRTSASGTEPGFLQISTPGILSLQIESGTSFLLIDNIKFGILEVPEPSALGLLGLGLAGLGLSRRRRFTI